MTYRLEFTDDPAAFLALAGAYLASEPVLSTVVTTSADRAARADEAGAPRPVHPQWFVTVLELDEDAPGTVVGAAMRTAPFAPYPLYVLPMPDEAARLLGRRLAERGEAEAGANGMLPAARLVAQEAARAVGGHVEAGRDSRLWVLGDLVRPPDPPGLARPATLDDLDLVLAWFTDFHPAVARQAGRAPGSHVDMVTADVIRQRVAEGLVWLWTEPSGAPVHMTAHNPPSCGVARIGPVYTPSEHRGHGYAAATVGFVSRLLRDRGAQACLFTDAANPVSNHVYASLGYRPVVDTADHLVVGEVASGRTP